MDRAAFRIAADERQMSRVEAIATEAGTDGRAARC